MESFSVEQDNFWFSNENRNITGIAHALDSLSSKITKRLGKGLASVFGQTLFANKDLSSPVSMWKKMHERMTPEAMEYYDKGRLLLVDIFNKYHSLSKGVSVSEKEIRDNYDAWSIEAVEYFFKLGKIFEEWFDYNNDSILLFIEKDQWVLRYRYGALARVFEETADYDTLLEIFDKMEEEDLKSLSLRSLKGFIETLLENEESEKCETILFRSETLFNEDYEDKYYYNSMQGWLNYLKKNYQESHRYNMKALDCTEKSGSWDRRYTGTVGEVIRSGLCSGIDIRGYFQTYIEKSQEFTPQMSIYSLNVQILNLLRSDENVELNVVQEKVESLMEDSKFEYSPKAVAQFFLNCAIDIFDWGHNNLTDTGKKYLHKSLEIYERFGRWEPMIQVLTLLLEKEQNQFVKPQYQEKFDKVKNYQNEVYRILDLSTQRNEFNWDIEEKILQENQSILQEFYDASINLNHTTNVELLLARSTVGAYSDWSLVEKYGGQWGRLYGLGSAIGRWKSPDFYGENEIDMVEHLERVYSEIGTPFAEAYALDKMAGNSNILAKEKQLKVLYRLNELLKQQGAERLRHINLERIARWYFSEGNEELGGKLYLELIMYWSKNYPQSAIYSTENYVKSLLKQKKFEKALEVITSFKNDHNPNPDKLISLDTLQSQCYLSLGEQHWMKGLELLKEHSTLILQKKFIHDSNFRKYNLTFSVYLATIHALERHQEKEEFVSKMRSSNFSISNVYHSAIYILTQNNFEVNSVTALHLEKIDYEFENNTENWGFSAMQRLISYLRRYDYDGFVIQCKNYLQKAIEKESAIDISRALINMRKNLKSFSGVEIRELCITVCDRIVIEKGSALDHAHYLDGKSSWFNPVEQRELLNSAFEIYIEYNHISQASWCLQNMIGGPLGVHDIIRKLHFDTDNGIKDGSLRCISMIEPFISELSESTSEEVIQSLEKLVQSPEFSDEEKEHVEFVKLTILIEQKRLDEAIRLLQSLLEQFPFEKEAWYLGQKFLTSWEEIASNAKDPQILEILATFIENLTDNQYNLRYWKSTAIQATKLRGKFTEPEKTSYNFQSEIISELENNPDTAVEKLETFIQEEIENPNLDKHLKSILFKAKGTRIEEILLLYFIEHSIKPKQIQSYILRLFEHYRITKRFDTSLEFIEQLLLTAQNESETEVAIGHFVKMLKEDFIYRERAEKSYQIILGKTVKLQRIFISSIKSNFNEKEINQLFKNLAYRFLETRSYNEAEIYYKQLLMSTETDGDHHALYVYRLALCQLGRNKTDEAIRLFHQYIELEEDEATHKALRKNMGVFFIEIGKENGFKILKLLYQKDKGRILLGKGDVLSIEDEYLHGLHKHPKLKINENFQNASNEIKSYSRSLKRKSGNDIYIILLDENDEVIDVKLPSLLPLKLNFINMYSEEE